MCCFSRPVRHVAGTRIFARACEHGRQFLVYSMRFEAVGDLAMILPLPVPPSSPEDAVRFVDLSGYPRFFDDLDRAFPAPAPRSKGFAPQALVSRDAPALAIHDVGDFEASFVPRVADFDRLDARFRLDPAVWHQLPGYADWGFAVFKLRDHDKPGWLSRMIGRGAASRERRVHPMALELPRRDTSALFFPTVHVHDGQVHQTAHFDHQLYAQVSGEVGAHGGWEASAQTLRHFMSVERTAGLVDGEQLALKRTIVGQHPNQDVALAS